MTASLLALLSSPALAGSEAADFFETRIRPLLAKNCFACHTGTQMGGLRLDARQNILKGGSRGPAIQPGSPQDSLLIQAVTQSHPELKMPPQGKLSPEQIEDLQAWIRDGAVWPEAQAAIAEQEPEQEYVIRPEYREFWSFQPVRKPEIQGLTATPGAERTWTGSFWSSSSNRASVPASGHRSACSFGAPRWT